MLKASRFSPALALLALSALPVAAATSCSSSPSSQPPPHPLTGSSGVSSSGSGGAGQGGASSSASSSKSAASSTGSGMGGMGGMGTGGMGTGGMSTGSGKPGDPCKDGKDCASQVCVNQLCQADSCIDNVKNQDETDVDCGGKNCMPCAPGKICNLDNDCTSSLCSQGLCQAPSCIDGVKNGGEPDIDCGGSCPKKCLTGKKCLNSTDCVSNSCLSNVCACPSGMVVMPIPGGAYCVDAYEVTYDEYALFWQNNPIANQPAYCSWNTTFTPQANWPALPAHGGFPITDVDWCDALSYCTFRGKHLCGNIKGGSNDMAAYKDVTQDQWFNACSAQGVNDYPYGDQYNGNFCEGKDEGQVNMSSQVCTPQGCKYTRAETDAFINTCQGGAPGLYQMAGNAAEWEDSCSGYTDDKDTCLVRGGSHCEVGVSLRCDAYVAQPRSYTGCDVGFRCCL